MAKQRNSLPIWRDANRLLVMVEECVRGFSRDHKYSVGEIYGSKKLDEYAN